MISKKQKIIVILGPTTSGKSELGVMLAKKFNGEIISADSRQIYRGLDIGTGKVPGKWKNGSFIYKGIRHHCIDFVSPRKTFSAAEYKKCAEDAINDIVGRNKIPILVGGTGFWIDAVVYDIKFPEVPPNQKLRARLEKKGPVELLKILKDLDPRRAKTIEQKNPRRLIRAIEITQTLGQVPSAKRHQCYNMLWVGINPAKTILKKKIHKRLYKRFAQGMEKEARKLKQNDLPWKRFYELGLEYRFLADYLKRRHTKKEVLKNLERAINDYARRQMTWFKRNREIYWIKNKKEAERLTRSFLKKRR